MIRNRYVTYVTSEERHAGRDRLRERHAKSTAGVTRIDYETAMPEGIAQFNNIFFDERDVC
jgi:hypothetical protein